MARLIDADNRIAEIKKIYCDGCDNYGGVKCRACWVDDAMCLIDDATTVDAVEVVRCKDCKYYFQDEIYGEICRHPELDFEIECYDHWINTKPEDFCSYGERKDGDGNG